MAYETSLAALADPTRRRVFEALKAGPRSVGRIAARLPVSRPAVSQHLKILKEAGLVSDEISGTRRIYRIDPNGLAQIRRWLDGFWDAALT
jgi:DNA-binding transcriptional ArsR family regulator